MPREGVPYPGGAICRLKCELKNLWQAVGTKLHSINGVPGDGAGNVKILAGSNVTISNDAVHNEIIISAVRSSEDFVKSVNGTLPDQDGDVTINTGVVTLNQIAPDADGDFTISAGSNITLTPGSNSIEIAAAGSVPEEWQIPDNLDWSVFTNGLYLSEDIIVGVKYYSTSNGEYDFFYFPKGINVQSAKLNCIYQSSAAYDKIWVGSCLLNNILQPASSTTLTWYPFKSTSSNTTISGKSYTANAVLERDNNATMKRTLTYPSTTNESVVTIWIKR